MPDFVDHPVFSSLSMELSEWLAALVRELLPGAELGAREAAEAVYLALRETVYHGGPPFDQLAPTSQARLLFWFERAPARELTRAIEALRREAHRRQPVHKKATPEQLALIQEAQREAAVDFSRFLPELTAWEADTILKGAVAISEIIRATGDRHFALRELRHAVRDYCRRSRSG